MPVPLLDPSVRETTVRVRRRVRAIEGVSGCEVLISSPGKKPHVRLLVSLDDAPDLAEVHRLLSVVDHEVRKILPNARVSIRSEPATGARRAYDEVWELVKSISEKEPGSRGAHNIHVHTTDGKLGVDFHLEVSAAMSVKEAHRVATQVERKLKAANPEISEVIIHEETTSDRVSSERSGHGTEATWYVDHVAKRFPEVKLARRPVIRRLDEKQLHVIMRVAFNPDLSMERANEISSRLEAAIKEGNPRIVRVDIVEEPSASETGPRRR